MSFEDELRQVATAPGRYDVVEDGTASPAGPLAPQWRRLFDLARERMGPLLSSPLFGTVAEMGIGYGEEMARDDPDGARAMVLDLMTGVIGALELTPSELFPPGSP